jgi:hypothetical protein
MCFWDFMPLPPNVSRVFDQHAVLLFAESSTVLIETFLLDGAEALSFHLHVAFGSCKRVDVLELAAFCK